MNNFKEGITLRQLQREWEMHVQHRSGKATSRIMSFLGLGPRVPIAAPRRKKKKKIRKVRRSATAPADNIESAPNDHRDQLDSADEISGVFIRRKPGPESGSNRPSTAPTKKLRVPQSAPITAKPVSTKKGAALARTVENSPFLHPVVPKILTAASPPRQRPRSAPAGGAARGSTSPMRFPGDNIPPDIFCSFPPEEVYNFLCQNGFVHYADQFMEMGIWGEDLLNSDDVDLQSCGVSFKPHRRRLLSLMDHIYNNRTVSHQEESNTQTVHQMNHGEHDTNGFADVNLTKSETVVENGSFVLSGKYGGITPVIKSVSRTVYQDDKELDRPFVESQEELSFIPPEESNDNRDASNYQVTSWIDTIGNSVDNADYTGENIVEQVLIENSMLGTLKLKQLSADSSPTREELLRSLRAAEAEIDRIRVVELEQLTAQLEEHRAFISRKKELQRELDKSNAEKAALEALDNSFQQLHPADNIDAQRQASFAACRSKAVSEAEELLELQRLKTENESLQRQMAERDAAINRMRPIPVDPTEIIRRNTVQVRNVENEAKSAADSAETSALYRIDSICSIKQTAVALALAEAARAHQAALTTAHEEERRKVELLQLRAEEEMSLKQKELDHLAATIREKEIEATQLLERMKEEEREIHLARLAAEEEAIMRAQEAEDLRRQLDAATEANQEMRRLAEESQQQMQVDGGGCDSDGYGDDFEESVAKEVVNTEVSLSATSVGSPSLACDSSDIEERAPPLSTGDKLSSSARNLAEGLRLRQENMEKDADANVGKMLTEIEIARQQEQRTLEAEREALQQITADQEAARQLLAEEIEKQRQLELQKLALEREVLLQEQAAAAALRRALEQEVEAIALEAETRRMEELAKIVAEREKIEAQKAAIEEEKANSVKISKDIEQKRLNELERLEAERAEFEKQFNKQQAFQLQQEVDAIRRAEALEAERLLEKERMTREKAGLDAERLKLKEQAFLCTELVLEAERNRLLEVSRIEIERSAFERRMAEAEQEKSRLTEAAEVYVQAELSRIALAELQKEMFDVASSTSSPPDELPQSLQKGIGGIVALNGAAAIYQLEPAASPRPSHNALTASVESQQASAPFEGPCSLADDERPLIIPTDQEQDLNDSTAAGTDARALSTTALMKNADVDTGDEVHAPIDIEAFSEHNSIGLTTCGGLMDEAVSSQTSDGVPASLLIESNIKGAASNFTDKLISSACPPLSTDFEDSGTAAEVDHVEADTVNLLPEDSHRGLALIFHIHNAMKANLNDMKDLLGNINKFSDFCVALMEFQRILSTHSAIEELDLFPLLSTLLKSPIDLEKLCAADSSLLDALRHAVSEAKMEGEAGPSIDRWFAVQTAFVMWWDSHLRHLSEEARVLMLVAHKDICSNDGHSLVVQEQLISPAVSRDANEFAFYCGWCMATLNKHGSQLLSPDSNVRSFVLALRNCCSTSQWNSLRQNIEGSCSSEVWKDLMSDSGIVDALGVEEYSNGDKSVEIAASADVPTGQLNKADQKVSNAADTTELDTSAALNSAVLITSQEVNHIDEASVTCGESAYTNAPVDAAPPTESTSGGTDQAPGFLGFGSDWTEVKGSGGGLYYNKSTKELREPHEIVTLTSAVDDRKLSVADVIQTTESEPKHADSDVDVTETAQHVPTEALPLIDSSVTAASASNHAEETKKDILPAVHRLDSDWIEVKGSFGGLYYHKSTKEFREPHEIFGTEAPTKDAHEDKAESTDGRNPLRKRSLGGSNDSDDDNASLMSVGQAITELEEDYLSRKKEKEKRDAPRFVNMPPPSSPVPGDPPRSVKKQLSFSARSPSFQEKVKLPYSPSFAELQQNLQLMPSSSYGTEFNADFDPLENLYYGSFKEQRQSSKSFRGNSPSHYQQGQDMSYSAFAPQDEYASNYEQHCGDYQQAYYATPDHQYPDTKSSGYDYERDLSNNYQTPTYHQYDSAYSGNNEYDNGYYVQQSEEDNPYWKWDPNVGWVPKEEHEITVAVTQRTPAQQMPIQRLSSGVLCPAYSIARKKSSWSKKSGDGSGRFGGDIPDFEDQARKNSSSNMLGLAFANSSEKIGPGGGQSDAASASPRSTLKDKKSSLWG